MTTSTGAHILAFPYPAQGHMLPLLDLTHQLAIRGLTITLLITPKNLPIITPLLSTHPTSITPLILPFPPHPSLPAGAENTKDIPIGSLRAMMRALGDLSYPITLWFNSHPSPPVAILSDFFLGWTQDLASQLGIKRLVFSPSGAFAISIINSLWRDMPRRNGEEDTIIPFDNIPFSPKYPFSQVSTVFRFYVEGDPEMEFIKEGMKGNLKSWGIVLNSFSELESVYLNHLKYELGNERVFAVGPLLPPNDASQERGFSSSVEVKDLLSFLDTCPDQSVVYICFGSQAVLRNQQIKAIARGLEISGARFVWSIKQPTTGHVEGEYGTVPQGFEDRVADRGFVIKGWAPQVTILTHRAVGSFLSHCGWNSILESLVAGKPMLTWPMGADQFTNATLLVDRMKVAVRVCEGAGTIPDADKLARKIKESVGGNRVLSLRAKELSEAALMAVKDGGSSCDDLNCLVRELNGLKAI
ncbi:hypothetical protein ACHQM5_008838 [Ranunculus cassubicifolius]